MLINSIALPTDAGHMLTNVVAIFMGLTAMVVQRDSSSLARDIDRGGQHHAADLNRDIHPLRGGQQLKEAPSISSVSIVMILAALAGQYHGSAVAAFTLGEQPGS
ncbi:hypothetical protein [Mycobacterium uberis]|uniref:hypothetical protein n=1 Tax=Mycobacterium uberis TaxID=2162698 RepID=UPI000E30AC5A|nr:hypothetical protein [Mycobacterium uberis]